MAYIFQSPGKPYSVETKFTSICLSWEKPKSISDKKITYKVYQKSQYDDRWDLKKATPKDDYHTVDGLMAGTKYIFKVSAKYEDEEEEYMGPPSEYIQTRASLGNTLINDCNITSGNSFRYQIKMEENKGARNADAKTRQLTFGSNSLFSNDELHIVLRKYFNARYLNIKMI